MQRLKRILENSRLSIYPLGNPKENIVRSI